MGEHENKGVFTGVYMGAHENTGVYKYMRVQGFIGRYMGVQENTGVSRGIHGCT